MREEGISSSADPLLFPNSSPPPPPTPAASSAGASSPAVAANAGGSKVGSLSRLASQPMWISSSTSAGGSALGSSQPSCRPWERGDLLRRLSTFKPANWFGKPKAASSLACARRGWVSVDVDKIECEYCGSNLKYIAPDSWTPAEGANVGEEFADQLDEGHRVTCPWRGNSCAESLVQFPPTPPSALIGGYKDRCDGLLQFLYLPIVAASALEQMRVSRGPEIDRFLVQSYTFTVGESGYKADVASSFENAKEEPLCVYSRAQKLISLCGWEPRWLPNVQDCEEHSAQSARNGCSFSPIKDCGPPEDRVANKKAVSTSIKKGPSKNERLGPLSKSESRSPLLDCSLCGATVRILDFLTVSRPARFAPNTVDVPETSKKMALTRGVSAASGICGWVAPDGMEKEHIEDLDEAATTGEGKSMSNIGVDLDLTMGGGFPTGNAHKAVISEQYQDTNIGKDLVIGQPAGSEVGDRAASYESRGPSTRKRNLDEGGSTVDRPNLMMQQADSVEGVVIDDEVNDSKQSSGPSKRTRESHEFEPYQQSYRRDSSGAGPSQTLYFDIEKDGPFHQGHEQGVGNPSTRDSTRASSVIAMDMAYRSSDDDSMESVENQPGDADDINYPSVSAFKSPDLNEASDLNLSNQAQQSTCPAAVRVTGEIGVSSTNIEEVLNTDTTTAHRRDGPSFAVSGGSVGMGASHEAEIHGADASIHRTESVVGDIEPVAEVTENQGQTGEFAADPGQMGDFVPEEMGREYPPSESQDLMSKSVGRADSGSKIVGSPKADSVESGEKTSNMNIASHDHSTRRSPSCNAVLCSGFEASKDEVTQAGKSSPADECGVNGIGPPNGESNFEEAVEFDPIKHHNFFCPWVNGNVAAAGVSNSSGSSSSAGALAFCGWQLTLDALDGFQTLEPNQNVESESAASLYKDDHQISARKLVARNSLSRSHGQN